MPNRRPGGMMSVEATIYISINQSVPSPDLAPLVVALRQSTPHSPIRIRSLITPQIIQIHNQPDLVIVQHPPYGLSVIVILIRLRHLSAGLSHLWQSIRSKSKTYIIVQKLYESSCSIPHQVVREDRTGLLGSHFGHCCGMVSGR